MPFLAFTVIHPHAGERAINVGRIIHIGAPSEEKKAAHPEAVSEIVTDAGPFLVKESLRVIRITLGQVGVPLLMQLDEVARRVEAAQQRVAEQPGSAGAAAVEEDEA